MKPNKFTVVPFKKLSSTKAWKITSELVRRKANGICYTCGKHYPFAKLNAGHFIEKIGNAGTYFDLDNLRAQCYHCNLKLHGNKAIYAMKLVKELGPGILEELNNRARKAKQWTTFELDVIAQHHQKLLDKCQTKQN